MDNNSIWKERGPGGDAVSLLKDTLDVSGVVARLLANRGFFDPGEASEFLHGRLRNLYNPFLFLDMEKAVDRIRSAIAGDEMILVYGDRDVDGITSTVLLVQSLYHFGAKRVEWYIPAQGEGYGVNTEAVERASSDGVTLIITVDCGIRSLEEVAVASRLGIDTVITDHHEPDETLPAAVAIIDPKRSEARYPFRELAGVGVTLKLCQGLFMSYDAAFPYKEDIVAVDLETTGFHPRLKKDDFTEIGAVRLRNMVPVDTFSTLVKPRRIIPDDAVELTGITNEMAADAPEPDQVIPTFLEFMEGAAFLAHNTGFDYKFLKTRLKQMKLPEVSYKLYDTLKMSRKHFPQENHKMGDICKRFGIDYSDGHRALGDARRCAQVMEYLYRATSRDWKRFLVEKLDLVAMGTVADMVPLTGENRVLAKWGLKVLAKTRRPGMQALMEHARMQNPGIVTGRDIGWGLGPLLNACGRMGKVDLGLELMMSTDPDGARRLGEAVAELNTLRKDRLKENYCVLRKLMEEQADPERDGIVLVVAEGIPHGVTGVVANRLVDEVNRPVVAVLVEGDEAVGSARSLGKYDICEALSRCSDLLIQFGGHRGAAGLTLAPDNLEELRKRLREVADETLTPEDLVKTVDYEMPLEIRLVDEDLLDSLGELEPYGADNPEPLFLFSGVRPDDVRIMGVGGEHLKLVFQHKKQRIEAVGWGMGSYGELICKKLTAVDFIASIGVNVWRNRRRIQLMMEDLRIAPTLERDQA